jgi:hypothetical protein
MGYNTKQFDQEAHYAKKTTKELQEELKRVETFYKQHCNGIAANFYVNYIAKLKLLIAERIGKHSK